MNYVERERLIRRAHETLIYFYPCFIFMIFRSPLICTSSSSEEEEEAPAKPAAKDDGVRRLIFKKHTYQLTLFYLPIPT